jgi:hypothetical protein
MVGLDCWYLLLRKYENSIHLIVIPNGHRLKSVV